MCANFTSDIQTPRGLRFSVKTFNKILMHQWYETVVSACNDYNSGETEKLKNGDVKNV